MDYLSLFSGIGGFELGIKNSKYGEELNCIGISEVDRYAKSIYERHFPEHKNFGDVTKIRTEELPEFELLVGGFPCQAFSVAGKRRGFNDTRGTLFFEIARILKDKRPKYFLLENVRGLLSNDSGKTFQTIIRVLSEVGYNVQWEVLNSKNYGVPQNRERLFIKGYFRGKCRPEVLHFTNTSGKINEKINSTNNLIQLNNYKKTSQSERVYSDKGISVCLNAGGNNGYYNISELDEHFKVVDENKGVTTTKNGDCFAVTTRQRGTPLHKKQDNYVLERVHGSNQPHRSITDGSYCPTLNCYRTPMVEFKEENNDNYLIRRLTPVECERLQGFPDNWTKYGVNDELISDTQRYKCCGNAVTTNVITHIFNNWDLKE